MHIWVTGAAGFAGRHVCAELKRGGHELTGVDCAPDPADDRCARWHQLDITDPGAVSACVRANRPEACLHLAGVAHVPAGWNRPQQVMQINVSGTLNLLEAIRTVSPSARVLVVTSSEVYGRSPRPAPLHEEDALLPTNLYGVSKMAADCATRLYHGRYGLPTLTARPQNHIGPGQSNAFVVTAFAEQLAQMTGLPPQEQILRVGNLDAQRDFTDVRDMARAYHLLLTKGRPGEAYNIATGRNISIRSVLEQLCERAGFHPRLEIDPDRYRPADNPPVLAVDKITADTGWSPAIPLEQTLSDIYASLVYPG